MTNRVVYLNGDYLAEQEAKISIFDRAVLFGDAVYEVVAVFNGKLLDFDAHHCRLQNGLNALSINCRITREEIVDICRELIKHNHIDEGLVYIQVTHGEGDRDFICNQNNVPNIFMFTQKKATSQSEFIKTGVSLQSYPDIRWARRDIKSTNLLGAILAKQTAKSAGAYEALLIDQQGYVTECGSASLFIVKDKKIITRPFSNDILPSITRKVIMSLCDQNKMQLEQRKFDLDEVLKADEVFISSASIYIFPVVCVDGSTIADGKPGEVSQQLRIIYFDVACKEAI